MQNTKINANPTKGFFIEMLTKDINLSDAIIDLIDNSIDGAKKIREDDDYSGLWIRLKISDQEFIVEDNCGGFSLESAKNYAFRFGRPSDAEDVKKSVGRFGVGMKRALFKLGNQFEVESKKEKDHFQVKVDVKEWEEDLDNWSFNYEQIDQLTTDLSSDGVHIRVKDLNKDVKEEFSDTTFISGLISELENALTFSIEKGIKITVNDVELANANIEFFRNDELKPYYHYAEINNVKLKIFAGIGPTGFPDEAGWYIYCNDRLVVKANKTNLTGWAAKRFEDGASVRKFHHIFAMFRGIVFFNSDSPKDLPLTTTKNGIDSTAGIYRYARSKMIESMIQVHSFLKQIDKMQDPDQYRKSLEADSEFYEIHTLNSNTSTQNSIFIGPEITTDEFISKKKFTTISFKAEKKLVDAAKNNARVGTNKDLGIEIFDYYIKMEEIEL